jgi:hypothetical protein
VIAVILGTFAGVLVLLVAAMWVGINTPEPAGHHHKPAKGRFEEARNWVAFKAGREVRMITRRQAERDNDAATERLFAGMEVPPEIARDAMPAGIWHYEGLTEPELAHYDDPQVMAHARMDEAAERAMWGVHYGEPGEPGWEGTGEEYAAAMAAGPLMPLPPEVATRNPFADLELYGPELAACPHCDSPYGTVHGPRCPYDPDEPEDPAEVVTPEDEADAYVGPVVPTERYDHLREGQYAEAGAVATGFFAAKMLDKYEAAQLLASYRERADAGAK